MTPYLSDQFKARVMPDKKIKRAKEAPDMADLPLFNGAIRGHEEAQEQAQPTFATTEGDPVCRP